MNFRTVSDMTALIQLNLEMYVDVDVVIGIPRSGMLPASILATFLNKPLGTLDSLIAGKVLTQGHTRRVDSHTNDSNEIRSNDVLLVLDDSIASGGSMIAAKKLVESLNLTNKIIFCAIYGSSSVNNIVDFTLESVRHPRVFEWNVMHHPYLKDCCVDIDGVLCRDPKNNENDDGERYLKFMRDVVPRVVPKHKIGHLVTNRLEKYRQVTEEWLARNNFQYGQLHMLNMPSAESRRELGDYHSHKTAVYKKTGACLFIESDPRQAILIANNSGKYVLSIDDSNMHAPDVTVESVINWTKVFLKRLRFFLKRFIKSNS